MLPYSKLRRIQCLKFLSPLPYIARPGADIPETNITATDFLTRRQVLMGGALGVRSALLGFFAHLFAFQLTLR
jgi:hypothetical protein